MTVTLDRTATQRTCNMNGCRRAVEPGFAACDDCVARLLRDAFGFPEPEPQSWHDRARAGIGRTSIVGGIPTRAEVVPPDRRAPQGAVGPTLEDPGDHHVYG